MNCRKLGDQLNIFENFLNNWIFIGIITFTLVVQILLVQFGGIAVRCYPLDLVQQSICIAIGFGGIVWGLLIKLVVRPQYFHKVKINEKPMT